MAEKWIMTTWIIRIKYGNSLIQWRFAFIMKSQGFVFLKIKTNLLPVSNLTWMQKNGRDGSLLTAIIPESIKYTKSHLKKKTMVTKNLYESMHPHEIPTMNYLIKKEFQDFENLRKTILIKEILFKNCNKKEHDYALESIQLEKELGELYAELLTFIKTLNIIPCV
jgi:hypothetical protein